MLNYLGCLAKMVLPLFSKVIAWNLGQNLASLGLFFPFIVAVSNKNMNILPVHQSIIPLQLYYILCI